MGKRQIGTQSASLIRRPRVFAISAAILILAGLSAHGGEQVPDFARMNVNSTSATHGQMISPRDYQGRVSGWYFGHAT